MSFDTEKIKLGREPVSIVEFDLDYCGEVFGVSPCTATGEKCYNTYSTCKDQANYNLTSKSYKFISKNANIPVGENYIPAVTKVTYSPTKLTFGEGLGYRSKVTILLQDFKHNDVGVDPYVTDRTYDTSQGTYFGKLNARNQYYNGRVMRIRTGYAAKPFSLTNFETREYIIDKVDFAADGTIKVTGIDILKKLDAKRSQCPVASEGYLSVALTDVATTFTLLPSGIGADYPATSGIVRIGDEILTYTTRTGDVFTGVARGQHGTTAEAADASEIVQLCVYYNAENVVDIIYDLLVNYADIDPAYIPYNDSVITPDEWDDEKARWLTLKDFTSIISQPTGVQELIEELTEQILSFFWWDELTQKIKLKVIAPARRDVIIEKLTEDYEIIENSVSVKSEDIKRYSEIWVYYNVKNWANTSDLEDFSKLYIKADLDSEGVNAYGDKRVKVIKSRWYVSDSHATTFADRFILMAVDSPKTLSIKVDAKESGIKQGDFVDISTRMVLDARGEPTAQRYHVIEMKEKTQGHIYQMTATTSGYAIEVNYGYIAPNTAVDYASATEADKELYAWISDNTGKMSDGTTAYKII